MAKPVTLGGQVGSQYPTPQAPSRPPKGVLKGPEGHQGPPRCLCHGWRLSEVPVSRMYAGQGSRVSRRREPQGVLETNHLELLLRRSYEHGVATLHVRRLCKVP